MQHRIFIMSPPVLIKKYGNRRLYDTGDSRYITLEELASKVRSGHDVRVVDAQNGEDLTQATLAQIILESGTAARVLPVALLTQLVRLGDDALGEFFSRYVTNALDMYLQAKRGVKTLASFNPFAQWMTSPWTDGGAPPSVSSAPQQPPPVDRHADDVATLRRELDELKRAMRPESVAAPSVGKPGAKRRPRRGTP